MAINGSDGVSDEEEKVHVPIEANEQSNETCDTNEGITENITVKNNVESIISIDLTKLLKESDGIVDELRTQLGDDYDVTISKVPNGHTIEFGEIEEILGWVINIDIKKKKKILDFFKDENKTENINIYTWKSKKDITLSIESEYVNNILEGIKVNNTYIFGEKIAA